MIVQFYWRIIEELRYLGEIVTFHDPSLQRQYSWWLRKNAAGLAFSREIEDVSAVSCLSAEMERLISLN